MSAIQAPRKITLAQFGPWLAKYAGAEFSSHSQRVDCVIGIGHIEPGKFVALYAIRVKTGLMIFELSEYYDSQAEAWQALENDEPCHPPMFFTEWVTHQYLTDKTARVEKFEI